MHTPFNQSLALDKRSKKNGKKENAGIGWSFTETEEETRRRRNSRKKRKEGGDEILG